MGSSEVLETFFLTIKKLFSQKYWSYIYFIKILIYFMFLYILPYKWAVFFLFPKGLLLVFNKATEFDLFFNLATHCKC